MRTDEERHVIDGQQLHIFKEDGHWKVWLNTEGGGDFDGMCIAVSDTREGAIIDAGECLDAIAGKLLSL